MSAASVLSGDEGGLSLRVYGGEAIVAPGVLYKSVLVTPSMTALEVIKRTLERYGESGDPAQYDLCYARVSEHKKKNFFGMRRSSRSKSEDHILRPDEAPVLVTETYTDESRRFELRLHKASKKSKKEKGGSSSSLPSPSDTPAKASPAVSPPERAGSGHIEVDADEVYPAHSGGTSPTSGLGASNNAASSHNSSATSLPVAEQAAMASIGAAIEEAHQETLEESVVVVNSRVLRFDVPSSSETDDHEPSVLVTDLDASAIRVSNLDNVASVVLQGASHDESCTDDLEVIQEQDESTVATRQAPVIPEVAESANANDTLTETAAASTESAAVEEPAAAAAANNAEEEAAAPSIVDFAQAIDNAVQNESSFLNDTVEVVDHHEALPEVPEEPIEEDQLNATTVERIAAAAENPLPVVNVLDVTVETSTVGANSVVNDSAFDASVAPTASDPVPEDLQDLSAIAEATESATATVASVSEDAPEAVEAPADEHVHIDVISSAIATSSQVVVHVEEFTAPLAAPAATTDAVEAAVSSNSEAEAAPAEAAQAAPVVEAEQVSAPVSETAVASSIVEVKQEDSDEAASPSAEPANLASPTPETVEAPAVAAAAPAAVAVAAPTPAPASAAVTETTVPKPVAGAGFRRALPLPRARIPEPSIPSTPVSLVKNTATVTAAPTPAATVAPANVPAAAPAAPNPAALIEEPSSVPQVTGIKCIDESLDRLSKQPASVAAPSSPVVDPGLVLGRRMRGLANKVLSDPEADAGSNEAKAPVEAIEEPDTNDRGLRTTIRNYETVGVRTSAPVPATPSTVTPADMGLRSTGVDFKELDRPRAAPPPTAPKQAQAGLRSTGVNLQELGRAPVTHTTRTAAPVPSAADLGLRSTGRDLTEFGRVAAPTTSRTAAPVPSAADLGLRSTGVDLTELGRTTAPAPTRTAAPVLPTGLRSTGVDLASLELRKSVSPPSSPKFERALRSTGTSVHELDRVSRPASSVTSSPKAYDIKLRPTSTSLAGTKRLSIIETEAANVSMGMPATVARAISDTGLRSTAPKPAADKPAEGAPRLARPEKLSFQDRMKLFQVKE